MDTTSGDQAWLCNTPACCSIWLDYIKSVQRPANTKYQSLSSMHHVFAMRLQCNRNPVASCSHHAVSSCHQDSFLSISWTISLNIRRRRSCRRSCLVPPAAGRSWRWLGEQHQDDEEQTEGDQRLVSNEDETADGKNGDQDGPDHERLGNETGDAVKGLC